MHSESSMQGTTTVTPLPPPLHSTPEDRTWHVCIREGRLAATCGADKAVRLFRRSLGDEAAWELLAELEDAHGRTVRQCEFSVDGRWLATCSFDGSVVVWAHSGQHTGWTPVKTLQGHENEVKGIAWNAAGTLLATCGRDKKVWIWIVPPLARGDGGGDEEEDDDDDMIVDTSAAEWECAAILTGHQGDVKRVVFHPTDDVLASTSYDDTIRLWARDPMVQDWVCVGTLTGHTNTVWDCKFIRDDVLVSCSQDLTVRIWQKQPPQQPLPQPTATTPVDVDKMQDVDDAAVLAHLEGRSSSAAVSRPSWILANTCSTPHWRTIYSLDWNPTHSLLLTCGGDDSIVLYRLDLARGFDLNVLSVVEHAHDMDVNCVRWLSPSSSQFASVGDDGLLKMWGVESLGGGGR